MTRVPFFSPIYSSRHPQERWAFLQGTTHFFNFGQKGYEICPFRKSSKIELKKISGFQPTWKGTALRVIALATLIIPLMMAIGAWIYTRANDFQVRHLSPMLKTLRQIRQDTKSLNSEKASTLAYVAKAMASVDQAKAIKVLEKALIVANALESLKKQEAFAAIAEAMAVINPQKTLEVARTAIEMHSEGYDEIKILNNKIKAMFAIISSAPNLPLNEATETITEALRLVETLYSDTKPQIVPRVLIAIAKSIPMEQHRREAIVKLAYQRATEIINIFSSYDLSFALAGIAGALLTIDKRRSLRLLKMIPCKTESIKAIADGLDFYIEPLQKTLEELEADILEACSQPLGYRASALALVVPSMARYDRQRAFQLAKQTISMTDTLQNSTRFLIIREMILRLTPLDPSLAVKLVHANGLSDPQKSLILKSIAEALSIEDLQKRSKWVAYYLENASNFWNVNLENV